MREDSHLLSSVCPSIVLSRHVQVLILALGQVQVWGSFFHCFGTYYPSIPKYTKFFYDSHWNFNTDNHTNISFSLTFSVKLFNFIKLQFLLYICRRNLVHREFFFFFLSLPFFFSRAAPVTYGSSWVGGWLRAIAASLCHSHGKTGSLTHSLRPGIEPESSRDYDDP